MWDCSIFLVDPKLAIASHKLDPKFERPKVPGVLRSLWRVSRPRGGNPAVRTGPKNSGGETRGGVKGLENVRCLRRLAQDNTGDH